MNRRPDHLRNTARRNAARVVLRNSEPIRTAARELGLPRHLTDPDPDFGETLPATRRRLSSGCLQTAFDFVWEADRIGTSLRVILAHCARA